MRRRKTSDIRRTHRSQETLESQIRDADDIVEESSWESFPASDPPAFVWRRRSGLKSN